jgi:phospholipase C
MGRSFSDQVALKVDNPSSALSGEAFLERVFNAYRSATSETGTNVWNTALLIGWDEPGGTYDHVPPGPVRPPDASAPPGECGFTFDRSGYRVPAVIVSPWVDSGSVYNEEYLHTSLIATLRKAWGLGDAFTQRDASARTFEHVFALDAPRDPKTWVAPRARAVPEWTMDPEVVGKGLSTLGKGMGPALIARAKQMGVQLPDELEDAKAPLPPALIVPFLRGIAGHFFPRLAGDARPASGR